MPKVIAKFKCRECNDVFEATSEEFAECKCGKCSVKPNAWSYSYKTNNGRKGSSIELLENKVYRFQEEYHQLPVEFMTIWNQIKTIKEEREKEYKYQPSIYIYEMQDKSADGNSFLASISVEVSEINSMNESTEIKFRAELNRKHDDETLIRRLKKFYDLFNGVLNKEVNIHDHDSLEELTDHWDRRQHQSYDYTFYV